MRQNRRASGAQLEARSTRKHATAYARAHACAQIENSKAIIFLAYTRIVVANVRTPPLAAASTALALVADVRALVYTRALARARVRAESKREKLSRARAQRAAFFLRVVKPAKSVLIAHSNNQRRLHAARAVLFCFIFFCPLESKNFCC